MSYESFLRDALTVPQSTNPAHTAAREVLSLRDENATLRVKNKFLREKAGYFRDDIEDGAVADAARLREALRDLKDAVSARLTRGEDEEPGQFDRAWTQALAALASAPSAPTPHETYMRVAEAWEAFQPHLDAAEEALARGIQWDGDTMQVLYEARAVVAKALEVGT